MIYPDFTTAYYGIIKDVYENPDFHSRPRDSLIKEKIGYKFVIEDARNRLPYIKGRNFSASYVIAELLWYLSGNNSTDWISNYSNFWSKISDDGKTANSAYGSRIFKTHNRIATTQTQWELVKQQLKLDKDSRRAIINIHTPADTENAKLDIPCTLALQFLIRDNKLHLVVNMRSSDIILGIAYDVPAFTVFQELMANELGVDVGTYTHISNSMHIYERDFKMCEDVISTKLTDKHVVMPAITKFPNIELLSSMESIARNASSEKALDAVKSCAKTLLDAGTIEEFEHDWILLFVSHRARKLDVDQTFRVEVLDQIKFDGYKEFKR